jgi:hypothetical protein
VRRGAAWFVLLGALSLGACAREGTSTVTATPNPNASRIGYVRMGELVKVHPLYAELARLDDDVQALELRSVVTVPRSGAEVAEEERELQHELDAATNATKKALADKQQEYGKREQAAIEAALGASAGAAGPSGAQIAGGVEQNARAQAQGAAAAAQHNFDVYRRQLIAQDTAATQSLNTSLGERLAREYEARAALLQRQEADFALQQASDDAAERLSLRTKMANLALDDAGRDDVKKQLDALNAKEADALGAMKNRDQAVLAALQQQLRAQLRSQLSVEAAQIHKRTIAKIKEREDDTRRALVGQIAELPPQGGQGGVMVPAGITAGQRAKLVTLHRQYQADFDKDASQTIARFQKTRADLTRRFQQLEGLDESAQAGAGQQIDALQKQRGDLYNQMVEQIGREVKAIAQRRGIEVVVSDVVAPAGGVDLTDDAKKDIESLHE